MIAPSLMKLITPPASANKTIRMIDENGWCAIVAGPDGPASVQEALALQRFELAAILMMRVDRDEAMLAQTPSAPAHTAGHIAYLAAAEPAAPMVWRGDTLGRTWKNEFR